MTRASEISISNSVRAFPALHPSSSQILDLAALSCASNNGFTIEMQVLSSDGVNRVFRGMATASSRKSAWRMMAWSMLFGRSVTTR